MAIIKKKSEFQILREIREVGEQIEKLREGSVKLGRVSYISLIQKLTQLKHELKVVRTKAVTGIEAESVKEYWKNVAKEERERTEKKKKEDARILAQAKREIKKDKAIVKDMAKDLSVAELETLLEEKKKEFKPKKNG